MLENPSITSKCPNSGQMLAYLTEESASNLKMIKLGKKLNLKKFNQEDQEFSVSLVNKTIFLLLPNWTKPPKIHPNPAKDSKTSPILLK